jgi:hypothetical protein
MSAFKRKNEPVCFWTLHNLLSYVNFFFHLVRKVPSLEPTQQSIKDIWFAKGFVANKQFLQPS